MNLTQKRGMPALGIIRAITKKEHELIRQFGVKRTHYLGNNLRDGDVGILVYKKNKDGLYEKVHSSQIDIDSITKILNYFWEVK